MTKKEKQTNHKKQDSIKSQKANPKIQTNLKRQIPKFKQISIGKSQNSNKSQKANPKIQANGKRQIPKFRQISKGKSQNSNK